MSGDRNSRPGRPRQRAPIGPDTGAGNNFDRRAALFSGSLVRCPTCCYSVPIMAKQLLITLAVAAIVVLIARMKRARTEARSAPRPSPDAIGSSSRTTSMIVGYSLAAIMILTTAGISWMRYQEANTIVSVEVLDTRSGQRTVYQVRRKELGEREFRTVDGRVVSLGASDRMERIE